MIVAQRVPDCEHACTALINPNTEAVISLVLPTLAVGVRELAPELDAPPRIRGAQLELKAFALAAYQMSSEHQRDACDGQRDSERGTKPETNYAHIPSRQWRLPRKDQ